ncbi:MAG: hypothetical protein ACYDBH_10945 [Acidobacteriaceae bacterium]
MFWKRRHLSERVPRFVAALIKASRRDAKASFRSRNRALRAQALLLRYCVLDRPDLAKRLLAGYPRLNPACCRGFAFAIAGWFHNFEMLRLLTDELAARDPRRAH